MPYSLSQGKVVAEGQSCSLPPGGAVEADILQVAVDNLAGRTSAAAVVVVVAGHTLQVLAHSSRGQQAQTDRLR